MSITDRAISKIAKKLEPFLRQQIRDMVGDKNLKGEGIVTSIHGTRYPGEDDSYGWRGQDVVDLTPRTAWYYQNEVARADRSATLDAYSGVIEAEAEASVVTGYAPYVYKNPCTLSFGWGTGQAGDAGGSYFILSNEIFLTEEWQIIDQIYLDPYLLLGTRSYVIGSEPGMLRNYGFKIEALANRSKDGSATLLKYSYVTNLYKDRDGVEMRVLTNHENGSLQYMVRDTNNCGRKSKWMVQALTSESWGNPAYYQESDRFPERFMDAANDPYQ